MRRSLPARYPDLGLICLGTFVLLVGVGAVVPIRAIYARQQGASMAELGLMASAFLLGGLLFQFPGGWASDRWGRKPLLVLGVAASGLISLLFLLSDHPWYFIALRFLEGAAGGAIGPSANAYVIDVVPSRERAAAFGWLGSANSAGFMIGPAIGGVLGDSFGYVAPFLFGGAVGLLTAVLLAARMSDLRPGSRAEPAEDPAALDDNRQASSRQVPRALFVPALAGALLLALAGGFGDGLFISLWTIWLDDLNAPISFIGFTFVTFSLPLMLLMPWTGRLADRYSLALLITLPGVLISGAYLVYAFSDNLLVIALIGLVEGALVAVIVPARSAYTANLSPENARGRIQGLVSTTTTLAGFVSSMIMMLLYEQGQSYPFLTLAAVQSTLTLLGGAIVWLIEKRSAQSVVMADAG